jgi:TonB family protein
MCRHFPRTASLVLLASLPFNLLISQPLVAASVVSPSAMQDEDGLTALMRAARDGEKKDLETLIKHGVDINARDKFGWTALIYASANGESSNIKALLAANADVNARDENGYTALMAAVQYNRGSAVKLLLSAGADPNAATNEGRTVAGFASGRSRTLETLSQAGAQVNVTVPSPAPPALDKAKTTPPVLLNRPTPSYTSKARDERVEGTVYLRVLIAVDGSVKKARVTVGLPCGLSYQAIEAASRLLFKPGTSNGKPIASWKSVEVHFNLRN